LKADFQSLKTELESGTQDLRVDNQYLKAELEKHTKDAANMQSDIQQLKIDTCIYRKLF